MKRNISLVNFLSQIGRRIDGLVFHFKFIYDEHIEHDFVFAGFNLANGGIRGLFVKCKSNEYFFGTLYRGQNPMSLDKLDTMIVNDLPINILNASRKAYLEKKCLSIEKGEVKPLTEFGTIIINSLLNRFFSAPYI